MADFTDLSKVTSTGKNNEKARKRGGVTGRMRLLPLGDGSAPAYEIPGNNNNNLSNSTLASSKLKVITQKRELIEAVRKANSPISLPGREPGSLMRSSSVGGLSSTSNEMPERDSSMRDIECLEDGVNANARKYNEHKLMVERRQREINALLDELRALQLETHELSRMANQETPLSKKSQRVHNEINHSTASMEEQLHLRRQLEHMIRRLQTSQLRVDAQLAAMTQTVELSGKEADEVKLLCRQLEAGKSRAVQFLQEVQLQLQVERKTRARELGDHEVRARNAHKMELWRLQRAQERAEMAAELRGDLSADEEAKLMRCIASRERANEALHEANLAKSQRAADYEEVLSQLKLATGAASLREVVDKVAAQSGTRLSLDREKAQAETRLATARVDKEQAVRALNELKASGIGGIELNREVYNTLENEIHQARTMLKVNKSAFERLDGVLSAVRQGAFGIAQRLQPFDDVLDGITLAGSGAGDGIVPSSPGPSSSLPGSPSNGLNALKNRGVTLDRSMAGPGAISAGAAAMRAESAEFLALAELKLTRILEIVGQPSVSSGFGYAGDAESGSDGLSGPGSSDDMSSTARYDLADERNAIWSPTDNSDPVVHQNNIRVRPDGRPQRGAALVFVPPRGEPSAESLDSARSDASSSGMTGVDDIGEVNALFVPSRDILKMSSSRHCAEVLRRKEMADKERAAAEKGISDEEMVSKQRKRTQQETDARLATSPPRRTGIDLLRATQLQTQGEAANTSDIGSSLAFVTQLSFQDL